MRTEHDATSDGELTAAGRLITPGTREATSLTVTFIRRHDVEKGGNAKKKVKKPLAVLLASSLDHV